MLLIAPARGQFSVAPYAALGYNDGFYSLKPDSASTHEDLADFTGIGVSAGCGADWQFGAFHARAQLDLLNLEQLLGDSLLLGAGLAGGIGVGYGVLDVELGAHYAQSLNRAPGYDSLYSVCGALLRTGVRLDAAGIALLIEPRRRQGIYRDNELMLALNASYRFRFIQPSAGAGLVLRNRYLTPGAAGNGTQLPLVISVGLTYTPLAPVTDFVSRVSLPRKLYWLSSSSW